MSVIDILSKSTIQNTKRKRVGRGMSSGYGKTCGRGHKGQKSRSGVSINGFEGGQMPIHRRLPKYGFNNPNKKYYQLINLDILQSLIDNKVIDSTKEVNSDQLYAARILKRITDEYKVLGRGDIKSAITINASLISKSAREKIEKIGGKILS
ncbi:MAG: 50S ribosomal protein L15 [Rickettsiales bacterium]|jgi:large subunit ribosomal protein L15|nr:50S ribosomal protein L15 [Rickettsiales bacterium]